MQEFNCGKAIFSSVNKAEVQKMAGMFFHRNLLGYAALTDREIGEAVKNQSTKTTKASSSLLSFPTIRLCLFVNVYTLAGWRHKGTVNPVSIQLLCWLRCIHYGSIRNFQTVLSSSRLF